MSIVGRIRNNSRKQFKSHGSKHLIQNMNHNRISFDSKNNKSMSQNKAYRDAIKQKYYPKENDNSKFIDQSMGEEDDKAGSFGKGNQVNQYYHNAKALENVLKEDKENMYKREKEKQNIVERKQKVASYSKLVREIHWDQEERSKPHKVEYKPLK